MSDLSALFPDFLVDFQPLNSSVKPKLPAPYARSDFQQGMPRQERIFRNGVATFPGTWRMDNEQHSIWLGWLEATGGIYGWHTAPVFGPGGYQTMKVRIVSGSMDPQRDGNHWLVSCQLETMDYRPPDATLVAAMMLTYGSDLSLEEIVALAQQGLAHIVGAFE